MSNPSALYTEPNCSLPALALTKRSLWSTLLLALLLIAALLFAFSAPTIAAPSDTAITQYVQNSALSGTSNVTVTYGEVLTVTMRFTVTADTVLTGPVYLSTRFNGITTTANNVLGLRFLGYQDPIAIGAGTPPLTPADFLSSTARTSPFTTILTWTFNTLTNPPGGNPYVYEVAYQVRPVWDGVADSATSIAIPGTNNQTYISWSPGGAGNTKTANNMTVAWRRPDLSYSTKVYRAVPDVRGGATVVYTITLRNGNSANFSPAYDLILTDTLDAHLTYVSAFPAPSSVISVPGQATLIIWNPANGSLLPNTPSLLYVTATLPITIPANPSYLNSATADYTTWPEVAPDEANYSNTLSANVVGGIAGSKQAIPTDNVRIGDTVTYTINITVSPNVYLNAPVFTDTLPRGFHYLPGTFILSGDFSLSGTPITTALGLNEGLVWLLNNVPPAGSPRYATITYVAGVTGLNTDNSLSYASAGELLNKQNADNTVQATWQNAESRTLAFVAPLTSRTRIAQPYLANATFFAITTNSWQPFTAPMEVGSIARYGLQVRNTGQITAYEVVLADLLPDGVSYQGALGVSPSNLQFLNYPSLGDTGLIKFTIDQLPVNTTVLVTFDTLVTNAARPGDIETSQYSVADYSSQPGGANDGNGNDNDYTGVYDRQYGGIAAAIPAPKVDSYLLKGLTAVKTDAPDPVLPGQVLTYFIAYSNTSAVYTAMNAVLVDTYDQWLTYSGSTSFPSVPAPVHDVNARTLTWNLGTLSPNSVSSRITATFQVKAPVPNAVRVLTNTIASDWDSPAPAMSRIVTTTLVQPIPTISLDDKDISVQANQLMTYTMIYSNASAVTGATTGTFTITLDYAPYLTFITSTGRLPVVPNGTIFTDTLGPGISRTVFLRMQVARPLPYNLTSFTSTATIYQPSADVSDSESEETAVWLPRYNLVKVNSSPGNPPVRPGDLIGYKIFVTNTGEVTGTNIVISDVWDINTYNQSLGTNWTNQGTYAVYTTIATLPPLAGVALDPMLMNVTNSVPSNVQVIHNTVYLTSTETTQQSTGHDTPIVGLLIQMTHQPDPVYPGQVLTYTINYIAYSPAIVAPVVTDTLPPEVTYIQCVGAESCDHANGKVVWSWPNGLIEGNSGAITVVVQAPPTEWMTLTNTYASNSAGGASYREGSSDYTYVGRPHMSITKQASTAVTPPAPGDLVLYTLTYTNFGSYKSTGTVVTDTVPVSASYQASSCSPQPCGESGGFVTWNVGEVPITTTRVLTMFVRIDPNAIAQSNITRTIVNTNYRLTADRNIFNENTPPIVNVVVMRPALVASKSASSSWIALNGLLTYTVRYTNTGGGVLTQLSFNDALDIRTLPISASPNCSVGQTVVCADANLAPGQSRQFTITIQRGSLGHNEVFTNVVNYFASNLYDTLPVTTTPPVEIIASNTSAGADFSATPRSGSCPLPVTFTNLSSGSGITGYLWNFGDGGTSTITNPVHVFNSANTFTVSLTVNVGANSSMRVRPAYILTTSCLFRVYLPLIRK